MAVYTFADLSDGLVHVLDCGSMGEARLVNWAGSGTAAIKMGDFFYPVPAGGLQAVACSGETEFSQSGCGAEECYAAVTAKDLPVHDFLMGGAGLICGLLLAWAFMKSL